MNFDMKTKYIFLMLVTLAFLFSCSEEDGILIGKKSLASSALSLEQAKLAIYEMGLDTAYMSESDNYYIVEEDILICKDSINTISTRQYRTTKYVNNYQTITIGVDNTIAVSTNWREAVKDAMDIYNLYTGLRFVYSESNPDIKITKGRNSDIYNCGAGTFPTSGKPGNMIVINANFFQDIDTFLDLSQKTFLLVHELGHNLGLRHSDGLSEGDGGIGLIQIPGTPTSDSQSFMNSNSCGRFWEGASAYDIIALKTLWPPKSLVTFVDGGSLSQMEVNYGGRLSRNVIPTSAGKVFAGWFKNAALTQAFNYGEEIKENITLYTKWRNRTNTVKLVVDSDTGSSERFTLSQITPVTLGDIEVGRGLNEWWEISKFTRETGVALTKIPYSFSITTYIEPYIWNANPSSYATYKWGDPIVLDSGEYVLTATFTKSLGVQNSADGKHGVIRTSIEY